jgi:hypothetical protein
MRNHSLLTTPRNVLVHAGLLAGASLVNGCTNRSGLQYSSGSGGKTGPETAGAGGGTQAAGASSAAVPLGGHAGGLGSAGGSAAGGTGGTVGGNSTLATGGRQSSHQVGDTSGRTLRGGRGRRAHLSWHLHLRTVVDFARRSLCRRSRHRHQRSHHPCAWGRGRSAQ